MSDLGGYLDLQVNGYAGVDFQDNDLAAEDLHLACQQLKADGTQAILATIITEHVEKMAARLARIVAIREKDPLVREMIPALHIEGPFLSPQDGYRGAHPKDAIRPADCDVMARLLEAGGGLVQLVSVAP